MAAWALGKPMMATADPAGALTAAPHRFLQLEGGRISDPHPQLLLGALLTNFSHSFS
jgi:hypothetical protein